LNIVPRPGDAARPTPAKQIRDIEQRS
jgi:hypothetical protein